MKVFLDTNVIVSALATRGICADLFRYVLAQHTLVTGEVVLAELRRALRRKLRLPMETIEEIERFLREHKVAAKPDKPSPLALRDADDKWVLASAIAAEADVLVTGDRDLLTVAAKAPLPIVDPRGFWKLLRRKGPADAD